MSAQLPFDRVGHFARIPAEIGSHHAVRLLVDTGIGLSLVHPDRAAEGLVEPTGQDYVGQRMSGQEVRVPLARARRLRLGTQVLRDVVLGLADFGARTGDGGFDGILGLDLLGELPLTVDPFAAAIRLGKCTPRGEPAIGIPVDLHRDGVAIDLRVGLRLPDESLVQVEVDTGSHVTILDDLFLEACAVDGTQARTERGTDETGHEFVRRFIQIPGALALDAAPATRHSSPTVMFQDIDLDGLVGTDFLDRFVQTYDTRAARVTLVPPIQPISGPTVSPSS